MPLSFRRTETAVGAGAADGEGGKTVWLLDEPFAALDTAGQSLVGRLMARHCGAGGMVIAATHDPLGLGNQSVRL